MWVPPWLRDDFCLPWNSLVLGPAGVVKLDLTYFVHGTEWEKCINLILHSQISSVLRAVGSS
jgi:hypothetical protein